MLDTTTPLGTSTVSDKNLFAINAAMSAFLEWHQPLDDELEVRVYGSIFRALERAPVENRLPIFRLAARFAVEQIEARRQQAIDDLRAVASDIGLVKLLGTATVENTLGAEFWGGSQGWEVRR